MTEINNGGPAFLGGRHWHPKSGAPAHQEGMTLRDWFAGNAPDVPDWWMAGDIPTPPPGWKEGDGAAAWDRAREHWLLNRIAAWRWAYADAVLAACENAKGLDQ